MKKDIVSRKDIEILVNEFYNKVREDKAIGFIFPDVAGVNWEKHLPRMYSFWENIVLNTGNYDGNPMIKHQDLHKKSPMNMEHFQRWTELFNQTVDELFEGDKAIFIKQRALSIATLMQIKIFS